MNNSRPQPPFCWRHDDTLPDDLIPDADAADEPPQEGAQGTSSWDELLYEMTHGALGVKPTRGTSSWDYQGWSGNPARCLFCRPGPCDYRCLVPDPADVAKDGRKLMMALSEPDDEGDLKTRQRGTPSNDGHKTQRKENQPGR